MRGRSLPGRSAVNFRVVLPEWRGSVHHGAVNSLDSSAPGTEARLAAAEGLDPNGLPSAEAFARLASELQGVDGVEETVDAVVQFAPQAVACSNASVVLITPRSQTRDHGGHGSAPGRVDLAVAYILARHASVAIAAATRRRGHKA